MQLAVVEYARNVLKFKGANTTEIDPKTKYPRHRYFAGAEEVDG